MKHSAKERIKEICLHGSPEEKRSLYVFDTSTPVEKIAFKFDIFTRTHFSRYYQREAAPFHKEMVLHYLQSYTENKNIMELAFRGAAKTSLLELVVVFILLNDVETRKKYIKILSRDLKNSKKMVTDIYNKLVELEGIYGDVFEADGKKKREETMSSFVMKKGVQVSAGTVGQAQRGHKQDAYRPDWLLFEDIEDRETISSAVITAGIIAKCDEAITGMAQDGCYVVNGNYISEDGTIEWFKTKPSVSTNITPIEKDGVPTWSVFTEKKISQLKAESIDYAGEYLCLKPNTLLLTKNGYKQIQELDVGDKVITHKGREQQILKVFESSSDDTLDITVAGKTVTITENHPVLTVRYGIENWVPAGNLIEGDLVVVIPHGKLRHG